jgi:hypothetical protein
MTPRAVTTIDFSEIKAVEVKCANCGSTTSIPLPRERLPLSFACVGCNTQLWHLEPMANSSTPGGAEIAGLIRCLGYWQAVKGAPFTLQFSVEGHVSGDKG